MAVLGIYSECVDNSVKVHLKVMLAPANCYLLHQGLFLFVYRPVEKLYNAPLRLQHDKMWKKVNGSEY